jgi:hypothetical protein
MGICDSVGFSAAADSWGRRFVGRGLLTGGFNEVSLLGPAVFLEDVGMKGPGLGSDSNALLVLPVWLRDFIWRIEKSEGTFFRELVTYRTRDCALCGGGDGQLAGLNSRRSRVWFSTNPRDPTRSRRLSEG